MDFSIDQDLAAPPATVLDALLDPDFIRITATIPKIGGAELLELTRNGDAARLRVRYRFTAPLSSAITRVIDPEKLTWVDDGDLCPRGVPLGPCAAARQLRRPA